MKFVRWFWLAVLLLTACGPKIINHPTPDLKVDFTPFEKAGCPANEYGTRLCEKDSPLYVLGCDRIQAVPDLMGGLTPAYPLAVCEYMPYYRPEVTDPFNVPQSDYFYNVGGPMPQLVRYVIFGEDGFQLIKNPDEFLQVYAPVETPDEALGFVLALNDVYAAYDQKFNIQYRYTTETLADTHVDQTAEGYVVHAFDYQFFGCGPHYYYAVDVLVTPDGNTREISRDKIYRDPKFDDLCQD